MYICIYIWYFALKFLPATQEEEGMTEAKPRSAHESQREPSPLRYSHAPPAGPVAFTWHFPDSAGEDDLEFDAVVAWL